MKNKWVKVNGVLISLIDIVSVSVVEKYSDNIHFTIYYKDESQFIIEYPNNIYDKKNSFDENMLVDKMYISRDKLISILTKKEKVEELINIY